MIRLPGLRARLALLVMVAVIPLCGLFAWSAIEGRQSALKAAHAGMQAQAHKVLALAEPVVRAGAPLQPALQALEWPEATVLGVVDGRGVVLASLPPGALAAGSTLDAGAAKALASGGDRVLQGYDARGERRLYARASQAGGGLSVVVSMPRAAVVAAPMRVLLVQMAALLLATLAGLLLARWMGERLIVRPAKAMLREASEIAAGNLEARIDVDTIYKGELARLCGALNDMAASLQARRAELDSAAQETSREHALLGLIIDSMGEGVIAADTRGRLILFNAAARAVFPMAAGAVLVEEWRTRHSLFELDGRTRREWEQGPLARALRGESADNDEALVRVAGAPDRIISLNIRPLTDAAQQRVGGLVVFTDITDRKAAEGLVRDQERVLELIASGLPLAPSLEAVVALIEGRLAGGLCSVLLRSANVLRVNAAPSLPAGFRQRIDNMPIVEGAGVCGTAAFRRETVVVDDIRTDPLTVPWRELAAEFGLAACWSTPVLAASGEVLGTFAIYFTEPRRPRPHELAMVDSAVRLARVAIERALAEEALRGSEELFRSMFANAAVGIALTDAQGRFMRANAAYCAMLGYSEAELLAMDFTLLTHPADRARQLKLHRELVAGERDSYVIEKRHIRKDGGVMWSRVTLSAARRPDGTLLSTTGVAEDIAARKSAAEELARTNRSLHVLSSCNEAMMRVEDERELLLEICRLAVDVGGYRMAWVGYARDDAQRSIVPMAHAGHEEGYLTLAKLTWDERTPQGQGPAGRTIRGGRMVVAEDVSLPASGFYWHEAALHRGLRSLICLPLRSGSRTFGLLALYSGEVHRPGEAEVKLLGELADNLAFGIGNLHARLERNRAQEEVRRLNDELEARVRRRTAQLEEANRELEAFSYSVSHDLRTPLSAIDGFSGMLERAAGAQLGERPRHYLGRIRAGVRQMGELIDDLLSLAQVSRASMQRETVDIGAMARKVFDGLHEHEPGRAAKIEIEPALLARGDWRLLMRVIENLAGNAWKFTSREPITRISVGSTGSAGPNEIFFIRDNGAGFDMAYAEKLFGTFQRLHTASEFPGTGIGLATVHRIVTRHGGQVWAESAPGQGATFYFSLPAREGGGDTPHST